MSREGWRWQEESDDTMTPGAELEVWPSKRGGVVVSTEDEDTLTIIRLPPAQALSLGKWLVENAITTTEETK